MITAVIPLRAGSKGIPGKNRMVVLGKPLYRWVLDEAVKSRVDNIVVATDDDIILEQMQVLSHGGPRRLIPFVRDPSNCTDEAPTEAVIRDVLDRSGLKPSVIVLLQATNIFTRAADIDAALSLLYDKYDSVVSVARLDRFQWTYNGPVNYDPQHRPRRQDGINPIYIENGAIYIVKRHIFEERNCRIGYKPRLYIMPWYSMWEVDNYIDIDIIKALRIGL